jgi:hypothetical protein
MNTPTGLSALNLSFQNQKEVFDIDGAPNYLDYILAAPAIVLAKSNSVVGLTLPNRDLSGTLTISPEIFDANGGGFGHLSINNLDGTVLVPKNAPLELPAGGSLALKATNVEILSPVTIPGGSLSITAYNYSPFYYSEQIFLDQQFTENNPAPEVVDGTGIIRVGPSVLINVDGTNFDERYTSSVVANSRRMLDAGSVSLEGYSILMDPTSGIHATGGIGYSARGKISKGNGGSIAILAGKDPALATSAGGTIQLSNDLQALSALKGGSLRIQAPEIVLMGQSGDSPILSQGSRLSLSPKFFQQGGFTDYFLVATGRPGSTNPTLEVKPGTIIHPTAQTLVAARPNNQPAQNELEARLLPIGVRAPASLSLTAQGYDDGFTLDQLESVGSIVIGGGAVIQTDPLGKVLLRGQILSIYGTINAPAGQISLTAAGKFPLSPETALTNTNFLTTLHLAPSARILAQGTTILTPDPYGRRAGQVLSGGSITIKGNIVAEEGAILDVSGGSDELDIHPSLLGATIRPTPAAGLTSRPWGQQSIRTQVDSNGGSITLQGSQIIFSDATLRGFAGGPSAIGGLLSFSSGGALATTGEDTTLFVKQSGRVIDPDNKNITVGSPIIGSEFFVASSFAKGGFDSLDLGYDKLSSSTGPVGGNIAFIGPVKISAPGYIRFASGGVITADDEVVLNASRIALGQDFILPLQPDETVVPIPMPFDDTTEAPKTVPPTSGPGSLSISARLVDVGTTVLKNIGRLSITATNGDIRGSGFLNVAGSVTLTAAQIYPVSLSRFEIFAYGDGSSVQINQSGTRSLPLSAGGELAIYSQNIINAGTLRAPFGSITLGWDGLDTNPATEDIDPPDNPVAGAEDFPVTQSLVLRAGSTTTV